MRTIRATRLGLPPAITDAWTLTLDPANQPILLSYADARGRTPERGQWTSPLTHTVYRFAEGWWEALVLPDSPTVFQFAQPLGLDAWLLVQARASSPADLNASVFGVGGDRLGSFHVGDGIEDVQTTADGRIWASYFDEGVLAKDGPNTAGLACFDAAGRCVFRYDTAAMSPPSDVPPIFDCYALNVASDRDAWLFHRLPYPLVQVRDGNIHRAWSNLGQIAEVMGSRAFAVAGGKALSAGGCHARGRLFRIDLDTMDAEEIHAVDDDGMPVASEGAAGRGSLLYLFDGRELLSVNAAEA